MKPNHLPLTACLTILACDPAKGPPDPPRSADAEPVNPASAGAKEIDAANPSAPVPATASATHLAVAVLDIRPVGEMVEIEVSLDRPVPADGRTRPSLRVGDEVTRRSRAGEGGRLDRVVFIVPADQYARMDAGADVIVHAGLLSNEAAPEKPRLRDAPEPAVRR